MNVSVRDKGEKTMGGGFWGGIIEGASDTIQKNKDRQADMQMKTQDSAREQAKMIMQGLIGGNIRPVQENETPTLNAPGMTMPATGLKNRLKAAFGLPTEQQTMPGQGYVAGDSVERQLKNENLAYMKNVNKQMGGGGDSSNANLIARRADTGEEVDLATAQAAIAQGDRNYIINQKQVTKAGVKETPLIKPPDLTKEEKDYMNLSTQVEETLNNIQDSVIPKLKNKKWGDWQTIQAQSKLIPFPAVRDQNVQDFKSAVLDLKQRIPFLRGGKQLTVTEAQRVDALLNPFGQTAETYAKNIEKLKREFLSGKQIMVGGVSAISRQGQQMQTTKNGQTSTGLKYTVE